LYPEYVKKHISLIIKISRRAPVACNPSYSGDKDKDDCSSRPAWANSSQDPISKIAITKKGWCGALCFLCSNTPQHQKKKKKKKKKPKSQIPQFKSGQKV
jgi:hypothetical protein